MTLDVYVCGCGEEFATKDGHDPNGCPFCYSPEIEFSHEVKDV